MADSAQLFTGVHDTPAYTRLFDRPTRVWVAAPLVLGAVSTVALVAANLESGHPRSVLLAGLATTAVLTGLGALVPRGRPNLAFRLSALAATLRPRVRSTTDTPLLAPPTDIIDNLWFAANGAVYACHLLAGLPYHLRPGRAKAAVADLHAILARELPADSWLFGLQVPQDQAQVLRAMVHGHRDRHGWVDSCTRIAADLAREAPGTRVYWLAVPVDAGRAGHSPAGQIAKLTDWAAGRDKDSDTSLAHYQALAADIATSLPPQFAAAPASAEMLDWFWRHNAWLGTCTAPMPRRQPQPAGRRIAGAELPAAEFDEGDQLHKPRRPRLLGWLPSRAAVVRVHSPAHLYPDSYQAVLPVVDAPEGGIAFPGSEFLAGLDDLPVAATLDWAINLTARPRELEFRRNDLAKGNVDDQFDQRGDLRNGHTELRSTARKINEYNRLLSANVDERPLGAAFLIHAGAADRAALDYAVKRLREEMTQSGQIVIRRHPGAQTRLWSAFNPGTGQRASGVDQFAHPTTATKWSRFVPLVSTLLGNMTGTLLGYNRANANNSVVMLDLPGAARRNHSPCLVCGGAPGGGKSYTAKRIVRAEVLKGAQAFIVDPDDYREWAAALADVPNTAVIDMAGDSFGCCPLRIFPDQVAGGYWLDFMIPMLGLDPRGAAVARLRTLLTPEGRAALGIDSTAALTRHLAALQPPATGPDTRPPAVAALAADLAPALAALRSWAGFEFTRAIFDDTLPIPDLAALDVTIWNTGSLDLPDAEEMSTPHLHANLSDRQRASVAIYSMLVRLARVTFFNNRDRFGLLVLEEAGALLNSRTGARDAHLISRRARKHYTGMIVITQNPIKDLALMGAEFITQQIIVPFHDEDLAKAVAARIGLPLDEHGELASHFLADPPDGELGDPTAFEEERAPAATGDPAAGRAFFVDEFGRCGPIQIAREPDPRLHHAYDTTPDQRRGALA